METFDNALKQDPKNPIAKSALEYGLILGLIAIVIQLLETYVPGMDHWSVGILTFAITIAAIVWAVKQYRDKKNDGFLSYGRGLGFTVLLGVVAGFVFAVFYYFFLAYISPETLNLLVDKEILMMEKFGLTDEQIAAATEGAYSPGKKAVGAFFGNVFGYFIIGLIVSAFLKRESR